MNAHQAKIERKEARRVLGDRTSSIVGALRDEVGRLVERVDTLEAARKTTEATFDAMLAVLTSLNSRLDALAKHAQDGSVSDRDARRPVSDRTA